MADAKKLSRLADLARNANWEALSVGLPESLPGSRLDGPTQTIPGGVVSPRFSKNRGGSLEGALRGKDRDFAGRPVMGAAGDAIVTQVTPLDWLGDLMDDPEQAEVVVERIKRRNPPRDPRAAVFRGSAASFDENARTPVDVVRSPGNQFDEVFSNTAGLSHPESRSIFMNAGRDPDVEGSYFEPGSIPVPDHEMTHALLDSYIPKSRDAKLREAHYENQPARMTVDPFDPEASYGFFDPETASFNPKMDFAGDGSQFQDAEYFLNNRRELTNLMFNFKRLAELVHDRDFGVDRGTAAELGRIILNEPSQFDELEDGVRYLDPEISKEGFRQGETAHGYERMKDYIRNMFRTASPAGKQILRDTLHQVGAVGVKNYLDEMDTNPLGGLLS